MQLISIWHKLTRQPDDPVRNCKVYKAVGCAHVDGMLCNMNTCDVVVNIQVTPRLIGETTRTGRYEEGTALAEQGDKP